MNGCHDAHRAAEVIQSGISLNELYETEPNQLNKVLRLIPTIRKLVPRGRSDRLTSHIQSKALIGLALLVRTGLPEKFLHRDMLAVPNDLSGPVGIVTTIQNVGSEAQQEAESNNENGLLAAAESIAYFAALIAVNLSVMNLLPLPALDGGRILFLLVDAVAIKVFHRKIPERFQAAVNAAGMALLLGFMLLVTFHDVFRLLK